MYYSLTFNSSSKSLFQVLITVITFLGFNFTILYSQEIPAEFQIKRKEVFEFTKAPVIEKAGDEISIVFEAKDFCDATVVIEDSEGNIVRHLASGVLGKNTPAPFQKDSLVQKLLWDRKNDLGKYMDNSNELTVRVSLGLKPVFEKSLFWSPYKRIGSNPPCFAISEDGIFIFEGLGVDSLRKYNHDGVYEKTLYPFSKNALKTAKDIQYEKFPQDGAVLPIKHGVKCKSTLFTYDNNKSHDKYGQAASTLSVNGKNIAIIAENLARINLNGDVPEVGFKGPSTSIKITDKIPLVKPISSAFSNDGKYIYSTGYRVNAGYQASFNGHWLPVVMRAEFNSKESAKVFIGDTKQESSGSENGQLKVPVCVIVDSENNILVADYMNDRIQVFNAEGKYIKSMKTEKPVVIGVHPKTKQVLVSSWIIVNDFIKSEKEKIEHKYTRYDSIDNPKVEFQSALPFTQYNGTTSFNRKGGLEYKVGYDFWAEETRIWVLPGMTIDIGGWGVETAKDDLRGTGVLILKEKDKSLVKIKDFHDNVVKDISRANPPALIRQRMYVHPKTGVLYIGEADSGVQKSFKQLVSINANNSETKLIDLPFTTEDMAIDLEGYFYLRSEFHVVRYESNTWKEIPFDYGVEAGSVGFDSLKMAKAVSCIELPATSKFGNWWHATGFDVSPKGDIVVSCFNSTTRHAQAPAGSENYYSKGGGKGKKQLYSPDIFPGRMVDVEMHIWDKFGKIKYTDAFPGSNIANGILLDKDDNLYVLIDENRMLGDKPYSPVWSSTMVKVKAGKAKMISSSKEIPLPLPMESRPKRPQDFSGGWVENAEWLYGGVGFSGWRSGGSCICWNARPAIDLLSRVFLPEIDHYSVAVLDTNGNLILRVGQFGNVDDGKPLIADGGPKNPTSIGGDEVAIFHAAYVATFSDRRLFIADGGNSRIVSVKLDYHNNYKTKLAESKK